MSRISRSDAARFHRDGFLRVPGLLEAGEISELMRDYLRAVGGEIRLTPARGRRTPGTLVQLGHPSYYIRQWREHPYMQRAAVLARELMGADVRFWYDQLLMKPPGCAATTPWHQDAGYWKGTEADQRGVTCWLALSAAPADSGCMEFVPGSHRRGIVEHRPTSGSELNDAIEVVATPAVGTAVAVPLAAGDATFHHCRTLHFTAGNRSGEPRCAVTLHFAPEDVVRGR